MNDCIRTALAWGSIVEDVKEQRLNIDRLQENQAIKELETAEKVLPKVVRECYRWLLCPVKHLHTDPKTMIEAFPINTSGSTFGIEVEKVCDENELVISTWSPIHLRTKLVELYWKDDKPAVAAKTFWEDTQKYLYLPRLKNRKVLEQAISKGAGTKDFFATALGQNGGKYEGFKFGDDNVHLDDTLLLIEPVAAAAYESSIKPPPIVKPGVIEPIPGGTTTVNEVSPVPGGGNGGTKPPDVPVVVPPTKPKSYYGSIAITPSGAKMQMVSVADEIISLLASDPNVVLKVTVEINADFSQGASDQIKRATSENAKALGFQSSEWE